ncbi:Cna B-type domain-containing protein, partial [Bacillus toyonensis]|uniref:Cna B-type domain-containing protein n=1 Tax=Bacillus toyonensis TaxID=155322 RepID=UPI003703FAFB
MTNAKVRQTKLQATRTCNHHNPTNPPQIIQLHLLQNPKLLHTKQLTLPTQSNYTFQKLHPYHPNRVPYNYQLKQHPLARYQSKV